MIRILSAAIFVFLSNSARADWPFEFLRISCDPIKKHFEAKVEVIYNVDEIYWEFDETARKKVVDQYAKAHGLYLVAGYAQNISCNFSSGTKIQLKTVPNQPTEKDLFPGAGATLRVNGNIVFSDLGFPANCLRKLDAVTVDGARLDLVKLVIKNRETTWVNELTKDLPLEVTISKGGRYSKTDPLKIKNCYNP